MKMKKSKTNQSLLNKNSWSNFSSNKLSSRAVKGLSSADLNRIVMAGFSDAINGSHPPIKSGNLANILSAKNIKKK